MTRKLKKIIVAVVVVVIVGVFGVYLKIRGVFDAELEAPTTVNVKPVPKDWAKAQAKRRKEKAAHIQQHAVAFDHFANFAVSNTDGIPLIILKLLPKVAPEFWGGDDNFLSVMGLFNDERLQGYPFPRGIGFSGLSRKEPFSNIDYASFTCGGCHIGRVRMPDGHMEYLDGGVNSQFDVIGYRLRIVNSLEKIYGNEKDPAARETLLEKTMLAALDNVHAADPQYFYKGYRHGDKNFDAAYEAGQIQLFKQNASHYISTFASHQESVYEGWRIIAKLVYGNIEQRILQGFPGMEDAIGFNAARTYLSLKESALTRLFAHLALPPSPGVTDIMVVWDQDSRNPRWNKNETDLINGGGQWNGHIPLPIYKNIAAQLTLGFENVDVSVSAFSDELLDKLPPTVYPFDVDVELAKQGQALFSQNCAVCHQPNNGKVYRNIGTHMGRAKIAGTVITLGAQLGFTADNVCSAETNVDMEGQIKQPCATYRGVSMKGKRKFAMTPPVTHDGYNALPLTGVWAQAPYLHNGSVPTLYHLLMPSTRPDKFMKSRLDYDTEKVGFAWELGSPAAVKGEGYVYDTTSSPIIGHQGHDKNIMQDGKAYKLNWEDEPTGAMAIIEYMKTL